MIRVQFTSDFLKKVNPQPSPPPPPPSLQTFGAFGATRIIPQPEEHHPEEHHPEEEKIFHLLDIADRYEFDSIRKQLVAIIDANEVHIDPIRKILIGCEHDDARHWVEPTFQEIVFRSDSLTEDEMHSLGFGRVAEICTAREQKFRANLGFNPSDSESFTSFLLCMSRTSFHETFISNIRSIFGKSNTIDQSTINLEVLFLGKH